jgi:hypothetical protein
MVLGNGAVRILWRVHVSNAPRLKLAFAGVRSAFTSTRWLAVIGLGLGCSGVLAVVSPGRGLSAVRRATESASLQRFAVGRTASAVSGGVVLLGTSPTKFVPAVYLNDATGVRHVLSRPPGCGFLILRARQILYRCSSPPTYRLTSLLASSPPRAIDIPGGAGPQALGTHWMEVATVINPTDSGHPDLKFSYYNFVSGVSRADPLRPGGRLTTDLNSPGLTTPICRPHRLPPAYDPTYGLEPGSVIRLGSVILSEATNVNGTRPVFKVERCGSSNAVTIDTVSGELSANSRFVIWRSNRSKLSGYALPSERPFTLRLPSPLAHIGLSPVLSDHFLYINDVDGTDAVWRMPLTALAHQSAPPSEK